ncbi:protein grainyhead [Trichonephila clavipes]|nr:protein grainyhead [Trichonephila clavipes]
MFREEKPSDEELKAWQFWHSRQHSVKQRILDADTKNSTGIIGQIDEITHNAIAFYWNPLESPAKVNIAVQCLSTDFSNQKGVKKSLRKRSTNQQEHFVMVSSIKKNRLIVKKKIGGWPKALEVAVERLRHSFVRSPRKSTRVAICELEIPQKTVRKVLRKKLKFKLYYLQLTQQMIDDDK